MAARVTLMFASLLCLTVVGHAQAQTTTSTAAVIYSVPVDNAPQAVGPKLRDAARVEGMRLASTPGVLHAQAAPQAPEHRLVKWGTIIGVIAGVTGGALQPTHSNGEYVLGNSRLTSTLALGGISGGIGALVGLAIERGRR
jgi:hypothetical protein